jgi:hypothetical protein
MATNKNSQQQSGDQGSRLPELASEIKKQLAEASGVLKRSLGFYRKAGKALTEAKKELDPKRGRGGPTWATWLKTEVGIDKRVAQFYMRLHKHWDKLVSHPDFRVDLHYAAALKLIRSAIPRNNRKAIAGKIGPTQAKEQAPDQVAQEVGTPAPQEVASGQGAVGDAQEGGPVLATPTPAQPAPNVTARLTGTAELTVTPTDDFSLDDVLELVRKGEATVQVQTGNITLENATVIATFKVVNHTYTLTDLGGLSAQAA